MTFTLRKNLTRPLSHGELDGNFEEVTQMVESANAVIADAGTKANEAAVSASSAQSSASSASSSAAAAEASAASAVDLITAGDASKGPGAIPFDGELAYTAGSAGLALAKVEALEYADGVPLTISHATQTVLRDDVIYRAILPATFPVELSGTWSTDELLLVSGDDVLRQDLSNEDNATKNAGLMFFGPALPYAAGSVGAAIQAIIANGLLSVTFKSVREYGVTLDGVTDDTADWLSAFIDARDNGVSLWMPAGSTLITDSLLYDTTGLGFYAGLRLFGAGQKNSRFINAINNAGVGGPTIRLTSGSVSSDQQHGGFISGVGFEQAGAGTGGHAIEYRGTWHQRFENIDAEAMTGAAMRVVNSAADADSSAHVEMNFIRAFGCVGPAFDSNGAMGGVTLHTIRNLYSTNCGGADAHVVIDGCIHFKIEQMSLTGAPGAPNYSANQKAIHIKATAVGCRNIEVGVGEIGNWLEKGIVVNAVQNLKLGGFRFVKRAGETTFTTGIELADGVLGTCNGVDIQPIGLQIDTAAPAFTFLKIGNGINERFSARSAVQTSFAGGNTYVTLDDTARARIGYLENASGRVLFSRGDQIGALTVSATGTTILDLLNGSAQRLGVTAAGAHTIQAPIGNNGQAMTLIINNNSGGVITVSFTGFTGINGYADPASGQSVSAAFIRDVFSGAWRQIGGWSSAT